MAIYSWFTHEKNGGFPVRELLPRLPGRVPGRSFPWKQKKPPVTSMSFAFLSSAWQKCRDMFDDSRRIFQKIPHEIPIITGTTMICWWNQSSKLSVFFFGWKPGDRAWLFALWFVEGSREAKQAGKTSKCCRANAVINPKPSGKHTKNYGKSPCLMGKSALNGHFQ